jgi:hypothetical protein
MDDDIPSPNSSNSVISSVRERFILLCVSGKRFQLTIIRLDGDLTAV